MLLRGSEKVNEPWLEKQALLLEDALIKECGGAILGPSVTANFDENGFELDFTVEAENLSEAYDKLGHVLAVVERVVGVSIDPEDSDEIRSSYASPEREHPPTVYA